MAFDKNVIPTIIKIVPSKLENEVMVEILNAYLKAFFQDAIFLPKLIQISLSGLELYTLFLV